MSPPPPVLKTIEVPLPPVAAFSLFAERLGSWWPVETHSISCASDTRPKALEIEPKTGGRIIETLQDGSESVWGHFSVFEPPLALEIVWYVGRTEAEATRIRVRFEKTDTGTKLILVHDGFEALGDAAEKQADGYRSGWDPVLGRYRAEAGAA